MRALSYIELPLTNDSRQVFTVDVVIDGVALHARVEIRYLSALDQWMISIWDDATSILLVNQVPLICSYGELNDLLLPFRYIRDGVGVGSLLVQHPGRRQNACLHYQPSPHDFPDPQYP